uniref:C2H2-type domain-containing protein n=1 Tax=Steinernema glaseri TaxID=37863 RepID=A0A1I7ZVW9_9BILA
MHSKVLFHNSERENAAFRDLFRDLLREEPSGSSERSAAQERHEPLSLGTPGPSSSGVAPAPGFSAATPQRAPVVAALPPILLRIKRPAEMPVLSPAVEVPETPEGGVTEQDRDGDVPMAGPSMADIPDERLEDEVGPEPDESVDVGAVALPPRMATSTRRWNPAQEFLCRVCEKTVRLGNRGRYELRAHIASHRHYKFKCPVAGCNTRYGPNGQTTHLKNVHKTDVRSLPPLERNLVDEQRIAFNMMADLLLHEYFPGLHV